MNQYNISIYTEFTVIAHIKYIWRHFNSWTVHCKLLWVERQKVMWKTLMNLISASYLLCTI